MPILIADRQAHFWAKVLKGDPNACWPWQLSAMATGYGQFWDGQTMRYAHRLAYEMTHGVVPAGWYVCHRCDNPPCCNPSHLFAGPPQENVDDKVAKGRQHRKLSMEKARQIRARYAAGGVTQVALGRDYGVDPRAIWQIVHGHYYRERQAQ